MKKKCLLIFALLGFVLTVHAQSYQVKGTIKGLPDGTVVSLVPMSHDHEKAVATDTLRNGQFNFSGKADFPLCVLLSNNDKPGHLAFMLENKPISITAEAKLIKNGDNSYYKFENVKVDGSPLSDTLRTYVKKRDKLDQLYEQTYAPFHDYFEKMNQAKMAKNQAMMDSLKSSPDAKAMAQAERNFFATVEKTYNDAINANKNTYWGPLLALYYYSYFTPEQIPLFESFSKEAQQSWYGQKMKSEIYPGGVAGEKAKSFQVKGDDGKVLTLEQIAEGKRYVLIDFWASWCVPCRREIPNVKKMYELYKDRGFSPISISIDKKEDAWRKALNQEKLTWPNFLDRMGAADTYNVHAIPAMYLIDAKTMTIIASGENARGQKLADKLAELYK
jgi:thiol-disulfide isomerase/thioredoxin